MVQKASPSVSHHFIHLCSFEICLHGYAFPLALTLPLLHSQISTYHVLLYVCLFLNPWAAFKFVLPQYALVDIAVHVSFCICEEHLWTHPRGEFAGGTKYMPTTFTKSCQIDLQKVKSC